MLPTEPTIESLLERNACLEALVDNLETKMRLMQHQMDGLLKRIYGRSSEKLNPGQLLFQEVLLEADKASAPVQEAMPVMPTTIKEHVRHKHGRSPLPEHLLRVNHVRDIPEEQKVCGCGKALKCIGEDVTERIDYKPTTMHVDVFHSPKYACSDNNCDGCGVKQAPALEGPIDRCEAGTGLLAHVIVEKYEHHTPLFRQELKFKRQDVPISRGTMCGWMDGTAKALTPLYNLKIEKILGHDIVLNDDTPVNMRYGPEPGIKQARMWATVGGEDLRYTLYNFTTGREKEGPLEFFRDYHGYFIADAYAGYNGLFELDITVDRKTGDIIYVACWAHARRYFVDAQKSAPRPAMEVLTLISKLYKIEAEIKNNTPEQRRCVRQKESKLWLDKIKVWLDANVSAHLPQSPMRQAINYTLRIWKALNVYCEDGRLPIDNNLAENAIRPIALGRKNWLFIGSENGGHTAAILMTFCATCRKLKIDTWAYLKDVLQRINAHPASRLHELLPDEWQAAQQSLTAGLLV
jgi:transposase